MIDTKADAVAELAAVIKEFNLPPSRVGREIASDPSFFNRVASPATTVTTATLDKIWKYVLRMRGQTEMTLTLTL